MFTGKIRKLSSKVYRGTSAPLRSLPSFLIAGAQKCGTSTLFYSLRKHPDIGMSIFKEINYFDYNFEHSLFWYKSHFPLIFNYRYSHVGEASPNYIFYPFCAERISDMLSDIKLIFLLRNPVERAYSHYHHQCRHGRERFNFPEAIHKEKERLSGEKKKLINGVKEFSLPYSRFSYCARGLYIEQLERYLNYFDRNQLLVLKSENFFEYPIKVLDRVIDFLGLPEWTPSDISVRNSGNYDDAMSDQIRFELTEFFKPFNERLREKFGEKFDWDLDQFQRV